MRSPICFADCEADLSTWSAMRVCKSGIWLMNLSDQSKPGNGNSSSHAKFHKIRRKVFDHSLRKTKDLRHQNKCEYSEEYKIKDEHDG